MKIAGRPHARRAAWLHYVQAAAERPASGPGPIPRQTRSRWRRQDLTEAVREWLAQRRAHAGGQVDGALGWERSGWRDLRLVPIAAALWAGAAWAMVGPSLGVDEQATAGWAVGLCCGLLAAAGCCLALVRGRSALRGVEGSRLMRGLSLLIMIAALAGGVGFVAGEARLSEDTAGPAGQLLRDGGRVTARLEILSEPRRQQASGRFDYGPRYTADARLLRGIRDGQQFTASARILLVGGDELRDLSAGSRVELPVEVSPRGPGSAFLTARGGLRSVEAAEGASAWRAASRAALRAHAAWLPPDSAGLVPALAVGDRSRLDPRLEEDLRRAGLTHLTAVSGANFAIIIGSTVLALRAIRLPRPVVHTASVLVLIGFLGVVGPEPSVLRAAAMGVVTLLALASGRSAAGSAALCVAVVAVLLTDPALALSYGFVLSVLATLGITLLSRPIATRLSVRLPMWIAGPMAVPLAAQLLCGPVVVLLEPAFQTWSLAANLIVAPLVPPITIAATLALVLLPLAGPWAWMATAVAGLPAELLAVVAHWVASLPGARLPWPEGPCGALAMLLVSVVNGALVVALGGRSADDLRAKLARWRLHGKVDA